MKRGEAVRLLEEGIAHEEAGRLREALDCYDAALALDTGLGRAHFNRGNVLQELGEHEVALAAYRRALELKPDSAAAHYNVGNVLFRLERYAEASESYRTALRQKPDFTDAHLALGVSLEAQGQLAEAEDSYRQAIACRSDYAQAYCNLGRVLAHLDRVEEAITAFRQAVIADVTHVDAYVSLATVLNDLGHFDEAEESLLRALELSDNDPEILMALGFVYRDAGRLAEAEERLRCALIELPAHADLHNDLGLVLFKIGRLSEAEQYYLKSLQIEPDRSGVLSNLATVYHVLGQFEKAEIIYRRSLEIEPDGVETLVNLGSMMSNLGRLDEAYEAYLRVLDFRPDYALARSNILFIRNYSIQDSSEVLFEEACTFGDVVQRLATARDAWRNSTDPDKFLRVGLVSGDLRSHAAGFFVEGVLGKVAKRYPQAFEFVAYSTNPQVDEVSQRIRSCCTDWVVVSGLSDEQMAERIAADGIDILIDLSGHTAHNRLPVFAWKPAPVQVNWLGYFATTGVKEIDYLIADPWTLPESEERFFTEKIWRLPETRLCFTAPDEDVSVMPLPALSNRYVTFGCFNNLAKMNDRVVALWARILKAVPGSRLFLKTKAFYEESVRLSVLDRFAAHGVASNALVFEGNTSRPEYFSAYNRVDIGLDPFPYPGGATTVEALWMGVPVLTLAGERFLSRQGVGLLMNAGLQDWVARDEEDYFAKAVKRASDLASLALLRSMLRRQVLASPIFDADRFAKHFERALRGMWNIWCERQL